MTDKTPQNPFVISRRTTLQMALAAMVAGPTIVMPRFGVAQDAPVDSWNWDWVNFSFGELPGPGLNLEAPLGELWRIPGDQFAPGDDEHRSWGAFYDNTIAGGHNGIVYINQPKDFPRTGDMLWARSLASGELLWTQNPQLILNTDEDQLREPRQVAIFGDLVLTSVAGHLWATNSQNGDLVWDFVFENGNTAEWIGVPIIVNGIGYCKTGSGIVALSLSNLPTIRWHAKLEPPFTLFSATDEYIFVSVGQYGYETELRVLNPSDGSEYWRFPLDYNGLLPIQGVTKNTTILNTGDSIAAIDESGTESWRVAWGGL